MNSDLARGRTPAAVKIALIAMLAVVTTFVVNAPTPALANRIAIVVNGTAITTLDVDRRMKLLRLQRSGGNIKQKAQEQLIEEAIKMEEVDRLRARVSDASVDQSFARFASANKLSPSQMSQALNQAGIGAKHFKEFIRVQMSWPRVVNARFRAGGRMSTEDLVSKMLERGGEKPTTTEYILQQIIFVVPASKRSSILNRRQREAEQFRQRFVGCDNSREFAKGLTDVSVRDLGRFMQPALPPSWKTLVEATQEGGTTKTRTTDNGVEFVAVCSAKQVSDDLAAETVIQFEAAQNPESSNENSEKYLKELRERARISYR